MLICRLCGPACAGFPLLSRTQLMSLRSPGWGAVTWGSSSLALGGGNWPGSVPRSEQSRTPLWWRGCEERVEAVCSGVRGSPQRQGSRVWFVETSFRSLLQSSESLTRKMSRRLCPYSRTLTVIEQGISLPFSCKHSPISHFLKSNPLGLCLQVS